jgi:hypothetical protein
MTPRATREDVQLCRGFSVSQWESLHPQLDNGDPKAWTCAIDVFERRMRERFLSSIDSLIQSDSRLDVSTQDSPPDCSTLPDDGDRSVVVPGFAIMALCCLLIETLQSFRAGGQSTADVFRIFLRRPSFRNEFNDDKLVTSFVGGVRNGVLHEAETRGWTIRRDGPPERIVASDGDRFILNRTSFYLAVRDEIEKYVAELRDPINEALRHRFVDKMSDIADRA